MKQSIKNLLWTSKRVFTSPGAFKSRMFWLKQMGRDTLYVVEECIPPLHKKLEGRRVARNKAIAEEKRSLEISATVKDLLERNCTDSMRNYFGHLTEDGREWFIPGGWNMSPFTATTNCDLLETCNFEVITDELLEKFGDDAEILPHPKFRNMEVLCFNSSRRDLVRRIAEISLKLNDYPIYDEDRFHQKEDEARWDNWESWGKHDLVNEVEKLVQAFLVTLGVEQTPTTMWQLEDASEDTQKAILEKLQELWYDKDCGQSNYTREDLLDTVIEQVKKEWKEK